MAISPTFEELLKKEGCLVALGVDSEQSALALRACGARVSAYGGFSASAIRGKPDNATLSYSEYMTSVRLVLAAAPETHFIIDGETGFGDPAKMMGDFSSIPNAAIVFIEDQVANDKRCGHMDRHAIVGVSEMQQRIKSALSGRTKNGPMLMSRTDARSAEGNIEAAISRAKAYLDAGVEAIFIEAPRSRAEIVKVATELQGVKLLANLIEGGKTPELSVKELRELGFSFIIRPIAVTLMYSKIVMEMVSEFTRTGELSEFYAKHGKPDLKQFCELIGLKPS